MHLVKVSSGFEGIIKIPWEQKIKYKFIVDGVWLLHEDQPTEVDPGGFVNNVYTAPAKPLTLQALETSSLPAEAKMLTAATANGNGTNGDRVVAKVVDKPEYAPQTLPKHIQSFTDTGGKIVGAELNTPDLSGFPPSPESMHVLPRFAPELDMIETTLPVPKAVGSISDVDSEARDKSADRPPVVNTPHIQPVAEESTERMIESSLTPINTHLTSEAVNQESTSERTPIPVIEPVDVTYLNDHLVVPSETSTIPTTANVEAESVSTSSAALIDAGVPTSSLLAVVGEESMADPEPAVILPTDSNLVTEEKTPRSVPEVTAPESCATDAAIVTERKIAQPIATPPVPTTPRKKTPTTSSIKGIQDSPSSQANSSLQTADNSPSSSRFNSVRKKRTSFFGKIKNIFHHDKEKEKK